MRVVGDGLIASAFKESDNFDGCLIFASGVSNSINPEVASFKREESLLVETIKQYGKLHLVYFSSCGVFSEELSSNPYYRHKLHMESIVRSSDKYTICRLPQLIGRSENKNTIINKFTNDLMTGKRTCIQKNATRYFIEIADLVDILEEVLAHCPPNQIVNIANPFKYSALEVYKAISRTLLMPENYVMVEGGLEYNIEIPPEVLVAAKRKEIRFCQEYLFNALSHQYPVILNKG